MRNPDGYAIQRSNRHHKPIEVLHMAMDNIIWTVISYNAPEVPGIADRPGRVKAWIDARSQSADVIVIRSRLGRVHEKIKCKPSSVYVAK